MARAGGVDTRVPELAEEVLELDDIFDVLDNWDEYLPKFKHVYPLSESEAPEVSGIVAVAEEEPVVPA